MLIRSIILNFSKKPKKLFLLDSLGALLTAFLLFVVIQQFDQYFRVPKIITTYLSLIAIGLCVFSAFCFLFVEKHWPNFIKTISIANLFYCTLTMGLLMKYYDQLTIIGIIYFSIEIAIILVLVYIELNVLKKITKKNKLTGSNHHH